MAQSLQAPLSIDSVFRRTVPFAKSIPIIPTVQSPLSNDTSSSKPLFMDCHSWSLRLVWKSWWLSWLSRMRLQPRPFVRHFYRATQPNQVQRAKLNGNWPTSKAIVPRSETEVNRKEEVQANLGQPWENNLHDRVERRTEVDSGCDLMLWFWFYCRLRFLFNFAALFAQRLLWKDK